MRTVHAVSAAGVLASLRAARALATDRAATATAADAARAAAAVTPAAASARLAVGPLGRFWRSLSPAGLAVGAAAYAAGTRPTLAPRGAVAQGVAAGLSLAVGYALGARGERLVHWARRGAHRADDAAGHPWSDAQPVARAVAGAGLAATAVVTLWTGAQGQRRLQRLWGLPATAQPDPRTLAVAAGAIVLPVIAQRRIRRRVHALRSLLGRWLPEPVAGVAGDALYTVGSILLLRAGFAEILGRYVTGRFAIRSGTISHQYERPTASTRSGSPASFEPWSGLGAEGRRFVGSGPSVEEIAELTGRPAVEPIRVYVGVTTHGKLVDPPDLDAMAARLVAELDRTRAWERDVLVLVTPTGSGWVDGPAVAAVEYLHGGRTAVAALQYSVNPSWVQLALELDLPARAGRALFEAVHARWRQLPPDSRPLLVPFGLSLGAYGSQAAFGSLEDVLSRAGGAVWAGSPRFTPLVTELTARRDAGSTQIHPVLDGGRHVRFATRNGGPQHLDALGPAGSPRVVYVQHPSDGVARWWWPELWRPDDWLREPAGQDVLPRLQWWPVITGVQLFLDMMVSDSDGIPAGYGHHYCGAYVDAWRWVTQPVEWDESRLAALRARLADVPR